MEKVVDKIVFTKNIMAEKTSREAEEPIQKSSPVCGIILYGMEYLQNYSYLQEWKDMNPDVRFYICTMCVETGDKLQKEKDFLKSLPDCIIINNPLLTWLLERINKQLVMQFLGDILRWYALQKMMELSTVAYVIEGDVKCVKPNWMTLHLPEIKQGITIFGRDRACIVSKGDSIKYIDSILQMYENTYTYLLVPKVFTGNFIYDMIEDDVNARLARDTDYEEAVETATTLTPADLERKETEFINDIPYSILGIGIRPISKFKFNLPKRPDFDAEREKCYIHEQKLKWMVGNSRKRKKRKRKTHRKRYSFKH